MRCDVEMANEREAKRYIDEARKRREKAKYVIKYEGNR